MIEEMEIGILLSIAGEAPKALADLAAQMADLDALVKSLTDSFGGLNDMLASTAGAASAAMGGLDGFVASSRLVNRTLGRTAIRTNEVARGYAAMANSIKGVTDAQDAMGASPMMMVGKTGGSTLAKDGAASGGFMAWHKGLKERSRGAWGAIGPAIGLDIGGHILGAILKPGLEYSHEKTQLFLAGDSPADYHAAVRQSQHVANTVPMETYSEALKQVNEARMIFGNSKDAVRELPALATMNAYMTATAGHKVDYTYNAAKALEEANVWKDPRAFQYGLNQMSKVYKATGGRVDPTDYLMVFKRAHGLPMQWTHNFDYRVLPTLMQEFKNTHGGADTVGTALFSMFQNLYGGSASQRNMKFLIKYGLESSKDIVTTNSKMWRGFVPGTVLEAPHQQYLLQKDPSQWIYKVLEPALERHGVNLQNKGQTEKALSELFQNRNTWGMVYTIIAQQEKIMRDSSLIGKALGDIRGLPVEMAHDAKAQWMNAGVQMNNLKTAAAMSWLPLFTHELTVVTDALEGMDKWALHNKGAMKLLFVAMEGLAVLVAGRLLFALGAWVMGPILQIPSLLMAFGTAIAAITPEMIADFGAIALETAVPIAAFGAFAVAMWGAYEAGEELGRGLHLLAQMMGWEQRGASFNTVTGGLSGTPAINHLIRRATDVSPYGKNSLTASEQKQVAQVNQAAFGMPVIHNHFHLDGQEVAHHLISSAVGAPTGPSQYSPYSTMPYPQNPAPAGG